MKSNDKARFATVLTAIADYYKQELSDGVLRIYWEGLKQYDLEAVEKAFWEHARNPDVGQFMPKIADVARMLQGRTQDQASLAWYKVDRALRCVGSYQDVVFDDALIHRVIAEMGGWIKLGTKEEKEWPFVANEFQNRYRGYRMRNETPEYPPILVGIANASNALEGKQRQEPILIGDGGKAKDVRLKGSFKPMIPMRPASEATETMRLQ